MSTEREARIVRSLSEFAGKSVEPCDLVATTVLTIDRIVGEEIEPFREETMRLREFVEEARMAANQERHDDTYHFLWDALEKLDAADKAEAGT